MVSYNKLVRDKIPEILDEKGISYEQRIASDEEYRDELIKKLVEEVEEFVEDESVEELGDVIEVINSLKTLPEYNGVENAREEKLNKKGGFEKRFILKGEK